MPRTTGDKMPSNTYVLVFNEQLDRAEVWFDTNWNDTGNRSLVGIFE